MSTEADFIEKELHGMASDVSLFYINDLLDIDNECYQELLDILNRAENEVKHTIKIFEKRKANWPKPVGLDHD